MLAADELGQVALFLRLGAVQRQLIHAEIRVRAITQSHRTRGPRYLLHRHRVREITQARAAMLRAHGEPQQAEIAGLAPQIAREFVAAVDFLRARRDALLRETTHLIADGVD